MTALLMTLLTQAHVHLERSGAGCYRADDQTAGWKEVALPSDAAALAAPPDIEQFRSGEKVLVTTEREVFDHLYRKPSWGVVGLDFEVTTDTQLLRVRFLQRLDGMRVEVRGGDGFGRSIPLLPERRFTGDTLNLEWKAEGVRSVTILLHHHVRGAPVVAEWSSARWQVIPQAPIARLTWLQPAGPALELCQRPNQPLHARAAALAGVAR